MYLGTAICMEQTLQCQLGVSIGEDWYLIVVVSALIAGSETVRRVFTSRHVRSQTVADQHAHLRKWFCSLQATLFSLVCNHLKLSQVVALPEDCFVVYT